MLRNRSLLTLLFVFDHREQNTTINHLNDDHISDYSYNDSSISDYSYDDPVSDIRIIDYYLTQDIVGDDIFSATIVAPVDTGKEVISLSLDFSGTVIQDGDVIKVTSIMDGDSQELTKSILETYYYKTAYFNGMDVEVEYMRGSNLAMELKRKLVVNSLAVEYSSVTAAGHSSVRHDVSTTAATDATTSTTKTTTTTTTTTTVSTKR